MAKAWSRRVDHLVDVRLRQRVRGRVEKEVERSAGPSQLIQWFSLSTIFPAAYTSLQAQVIDSMTVSCDDTLQRGFSQEIIQSRNRSAT